MQLGEGLKTASITEVMSAISRGYERHFDVRFLDSAELKQCESSTCYARKLALLPDAQGVTHVLLVSMESFDPRQDEVSILGIDLKTSAPFEKLESHVFATIELLESRMIEFSNEVIQVVDMAFPRGDIELTIDRAKLPLILDGQLIGHSNHHTVYIRDIFEGRHILSISAESIEPIRLEVIVSSDKIAKLNIKTVSRRGVTLKPVLFVSGIITSVLGLGLTSWALTQDEQASDILCLVAEGVDDSACGHGREFLSFGFGPTGGDPNPGILAIAPLGYSTALMGVTWLTASVLAPEDNYSQWIVASVGVLAGVLAYGLSVGLDGHTGFDVP